MFRRRRRASRLTVLLGLVAALVVGWMLAASTASSSMPVSPLVGAAAADAAQAAPLTGAVDVTGTPVGGALGWTAERTQPGRYQLTFDADLALDVMSWDVPASVTVKPVDVGTWLVDFIEAGVPVDTAFSFTATVVPE